MITGSTRVIAHIGFPTTTFTAPRIYNPWFEQVGADVVVVPFAVRDAGLAATVTAWRSMENLVGALVTMPHKQAILPFLDSRTEAVEIAGACNAVRRGDDGALHGDLFDGVGLVRALRATQFRFAKQSCFIAGCGGAGAAIAAALAAHGVAHLSLFDADASRAKLLARRLQDRYPQVEVTEGLANPEGHNLVVNATPLGMAPGDPSPVALDRILPGTWVADITLGATPSLLLQHGRTLGPVVAGTDMLFEQIPAYLEFFGFEPPAVSQLRAAAGL